MKFGKRRKETDAPGSADAHAPAATSAPPPATVSWTAPATEPAAPAYEPEEAAGAGRPPYAEPVVEGEAVELPAAEPPAPEFHQPVPLSYRGAQPAPAAMPCPAGAQPAPAAMPFPAGEQPVAAVMELARERPEVVVAAAFAGGVLAALILRRLGN